MTTTTQRAGRVFVERRVVKHPRQAVSRSSVCSVSERSGRARRERVQRECCWLSLSLLSPAGCNNSLCFPRRHPTRIQQNDMHCRPCEMSDKLMSGLRGAPLWYLCVWFLSLLNRLDAEGEAKALSPRRVPATIAKDKFQIYTVSPERRGPYVRRLGKHCCRAVYVLDGV